MHFITLINYTEKGIKEIKDAPKRVEDARKVAQSFGGDFIHIFYTLGSYDVVAISEFPNPEAAVKSALVIAGAGAVRTETLVAYSVESFKEILKDLPW